MCKKSRAQKDCLLHNGTKRLPLSPLKEWAQVSSFMKCIHWGTLAKISHNCRGSLSIGAPRVHSTRVLLRCPLLPSLLPPPPFFYSYFFPLSLPICSITSPGRCYHFPSSVLPPPHSGHHGAMLLVSDDENHQRTLQSRNDIAK